MGDQVKCLPLRACLATWFGLPALLRPRGPLTFLSCSQPHLQPYPYAVDGPPWRYTSHYQGRCRAGDAPTNRRPRRHLRHRRRRSRNPRRHRRRHGRWTKVPPTGRRSTSTPPPRRPHILRAPPGRPISHADGHYGIAPLHATGKCPAPRLRWPGLCRLPVAVGSGRGWRRRRSRHHRR